MEYYLELGLYVERENLTDSDFEKLCRNFEEFKDVIHLSYLASASSFSIEPVPDNSYSEKIEHLGGHDREVTPIEIKAIPKVNMELEDRVNSPKHYSKRYSKEVIESIQALSTPDEYRGYLKGNIIKYTARYQDKGGVEDLEKANWYNNALIEFEEDQTINSQEC